MAIDDYTVSLERLDSILINTLAPSCFNCLCLFEVTDVACVKVAVAGREPLRFHDGECMQHFTLGCYAFLQNRAEMRIKGRLQ